MPGTNEKSQGKRVTYLKVRDGQWIRPNGEAFKHACCDCGLVHTMNFRVEAGGVEFQVFRDNRATAGRRRGLKRAT